MCGGVGGEGRGEAEAYMDWRGRYRMKREKMSAERVGAQEAGRVLDARPNAVRI